MVTCPAHPPASPVSERSEDRRSSRSGATFGPGRNLGDDDPPHAAIKLFHFPFGPDRKTAALLPGFDNRRAIFDQGTACRKIRTLYELANGFDRRVLIVDQSQQRIAQLFHVMRIEVAIPTAMPWAPFARRLGKAVSTTIGSASPS